MKYILVLGSLIALGACGSTPTVESVGAEIDALKAQIWEQDAALTRIAAERKETGKLPDSDEKIAKLVELDTQEKEHREVKGSLLAAAADLETVHAQLKEEAARKKAEEAEEQARLKAEADSEARRKVDELATGDSEARRKLDEEVAARKAIQDAEQARLKAAADTEAKRKTDVEAAARKAIQDAEQARLKAAADAEARRKMDEQVATKKKPEIVVAPPVQGASGGTTVTVDSSLDLEIEVQDGTGKSSKLLSLARKEKFSQEAAVAGEHKIRCVSSTLQKSGTGLTLMDPQPTALADRTFTATRAGSGWIVRCADGSALPAEGQVLGAWNDAIRLLPQADAKEWTVPAADVAALIAPASLSQAVGVISCKLESNMDNRLTIFFSGSLAGTGADGTALKVDVKIGRFVYDNARKRPMSVTLSGAVASTREIVEIFQRPNSEEPEKRKVGDISVKSRRLEITINFQ